MSECMPKFHVLIIGAAQGTTGLLIGQGLKQAGISYRIYEKSDAETYRGRQRDWTMALHWGSEYLETCLPENLRSRLRDTEPDPWVKLSADQETRMPICNGETGEVIVEAQAATTRRVSRDKLRKLIGQGLDVRYGSKVVSIHDDDSEVRVRFENGQEAIGHAIVGCDSATSFVREYLLGHEKAACEDYPVTTYNFTCRYPAEQATYLRNALHPLLKLEVHPKQNIWYMIAAMDIRDPSNPESWTFQHFFNLWNDSNGEGEIPDSARERLNHFKSITCNHAEPFRSASQWVPEEAFIPKDKIKHWPRPCRWDSHGGRVTLAGDAAHPMVPYRGQGLNNGLQDAALYVQALKSVFAPDKQDQLLSSRLSNAIDTYDAEMFERGSREIQLSAEQGYRSMHWDHFLSSPIVKHGLKKISE